MNKDQSHWDTTSKMLAHIKVNHIYSKNNHKTSQVHIVLDTGSPSTYLTDAVKKSAISQSWC